MKLEEKKGPHVQKPALVYNSKNLHTEINRAEIER